jgi:hypothetical protein
LQGEGGSLTEFRGTRRVVPASSGCGAALLFVESKAICEFLTSNLHNKD